MGSPDELLANALRLYREDDLSRAQILLETLDIDGLEGELRVEARYLYGLVLARRGDAPEAARQFATCVRMDRNFLPALDAWGNVLASLGDIRGAIDKYRRALAIAPPGMQAHVLFNHGSLLRRGGFHVRALRKFREAFRHDPEHADAACMAASCYLSLGRPRGAHKWLAIALKLQPDSPRNHTLLGDAFALERRHALAVAAFSRALEIDESWHDAWHNWGAMLVAEGDYVGAIRTLKSGLRHHPHSFPLLVQHVHCLRQMGAWDAALAAVRRARQEQPPEQDLFVDVLTSNEAAVLHAIGRGHKAWGMMLELLRAAAAPCRHVVAELRRQAARKRAAKRFELVAHVTPAGAEFEDSAPRGEYRRSYIVAANDVREARRYARELEPQDAQVRFGATVDISPASADDTRGVVDRSHAM